MSDFMIKALVSGAKASQCRGYIVDRKMGKKSTISSLTFGGMRGG